MNILLILLGALGAFALAYRFYARWIGRVLRQSDRVPTPALTQPDGRDFVPAPLPVLFSHHFATIAGAGPIVGPTLASAYGIYPALLWVLLGSIFIGAVHDYTAMFVSLREKGRSIVQTTGDLTGRLGFFLYIAFTLVMIVLVTGAFLDLSVAALTGAAPAAKLGLPAGNPLGWHLSVAADGTQLVQVGGIATTSVLVMTFAAPLLGWLMHRRRLGALPGGLLACGIALASVWLGLHWPVSFSGLLPEQVRMIWMLLLAGYVLAASALPVWLVLQPRDYINVFTLIGGMLLLGAGCIVGGAQGLRIDPAIAWTPAAGVARLGPIWPVLFITVACGAISGFHALVSSGTSSRQCSRESGARRVGYGAMLTEGLLAVLVLCAIGAGLRGDGLGSIVYPAAGAGNPVLGFSLGLALLAQEALHIPAWLGTVFGLLMIEGFLVTTLDTTVRLNRYLLEELWRFIAPRAPRFLHNPYFNSALCVAAMLALAWNNGYKTIWPVFGTANQLLAALTLSTVSIWLVQRARPAWFTLLPALFMMSTCLYSLLLLLKKELGKLGAAADSAAAAASGPNWAVVLVAALLLALSLGVVWVAGRALLDFGQGRRERVLTDPADAYAAS